MTRRDALYRLARAIVEDDSEAMVRAEDDLAGQIERARTVADLEGRERVLRAIRKTHGFADAVDAVVTSTRFDEAIRAIASRTPALAKTAKAVAEVHRAAGIAFARAATQAIAGQVQRVLVGAMSRGQDRGEAKARMADIVDWTDAYRDTVYRTNLASAYTEGQFAQIRDPDVADLVAGFEYDATMDSDTRPNHRAAHGMRAPVDDPVWHRMRPPAGYNCRCALRIITASEAKRRGWLRGGVLPPGRLPVGAFPDPGFTLGPMP